MRRVRKPRREPTIALINIVFLMLVFFMVAGTLAAPLDKDVSLVNTSDLEGRPPPNALVIDAQGELRFRGALVADTSLFVAGLSAEDRETVRIVPDRALPATTLVDLGRSLKRAGAGQVIIVTERGLQ